MPAFLVPKNVVFMSFSAIVKTPILAIRRAK